MAYDIIRWICGGILFVILLLILCIVLKKKGKGAVTAAFVSIILTAVAFVVPIENYVHTFKDVEDIFAYKHHEELLTYFQCDDGVVCIAGRPDGSNINYYFDKKDGKLQIPFSLTDDTQRRSSKYGIYMIKNFENQTMVFTQVSDSEYDGAKFKDGGMGYYYMVIDGFFIPSKLSVSGEKVTLV